jgi:hypothetical protein
MAAGALPVPARISWSMIPRAGSSSCCSQIQVLSFSRTAKRNRWLAVTRGGSKFARRSPVTHATRPRLKAALTRPTRAGNREIKAQN